MLLPVTIFNYLSVLYLLGEQLTATASLNRTLPVAHSLIGETIAEVDITSVFEHHTTLDRVAVVGKRLVDIDARLGITVLTVEYPGVGVEESGVLGFGLDGLLAHLRSLVESRVLLAEIVGIVVETLYVVVLPLQTVVEGLKGFLLLVLVVQDITHHRVEVTDDVLVALVVGKRHTPVQRAECFVVALILVTREAEEVVEREFIGVVLGALFAELYDLLPVLFFPIRLDEFKPYRAVVGLEAEQAGTRLTHLGFGKFLEVEVCQPEFGQGSVVDTQLLLLVKESDHAGTVVATRFIVLDEGFHHGEAGLVFSLGVVQDALQAVVGKVVLTHRLVIVIHRAEHIGIARLLGEGFGEYLECLALSAVLHEPVAHHHLIVDVIGMLSHELLERRQSFLALAFESVDAHLAQRDVFAAALYLLQAVQAVYHAVIGFLLVIDTEQNLQQVGTAAVLARQTLIHRRSLVQLVVAVVTQGEGLEVSLVVGAQTDGLLEISLDYRVIAVVGIVFGEEEVGLCGIGVEVAALFEQTACDGVVALETLADRLEEEAVHAALVLGREDGSCRHDHLLALGLGGQRQQRHQQHRSHQDIAIVGFHHRQQVISPPYDHNRRHRARYRRARRRAGTLSAHGAPPPSGRCARRR